MASKTVVILGSRGALGSAIARKFADERWGRILVGISPNPSADDTRSIYVDLSGVKSPKSQFDIISARLESFLGSESPGVDAVVNVSGGFCMDSANVCKRIHPNHTLVSQKRYSRISNQCTPVVLFLLSSQRTWLHGF